MQIQPVGNYKFNQNFGTVYASGPELSKCQEVVAKSLAKEFREMKSYLKGISLEEHYKHKGYDFIIRPLGSESVSLDAYKGMIIEKSEFGKKATYQNCNKKHIGKYDISSIGNLAKDLMKSFSVLI